MMTHSELCKVAEKWLESVSCGVVLRDPFRAK